jgi:hypothetical protein
MLILIVLVLAFVVGLVLGGSFRSWERMQLHWWGLAILGVALQAVPVPEGWASRDTIGWAMLDLALLAFVAVNRRVPGAALMAAGLILNLAVVAPNQGMPVSSWAVREAAGGAEISQVRLPQDSAKHHVATEDDVLRFLGDVIPIPPPFRVVLSIGDVLLYAGVAWFVVIVTRGRFRENRRPPARWMRMYRGKHASLAYRLPGRRRSPSAGDPAAGGTSGTAP